MKHLLAVVFLLCAGAVRADEPGAKPAGVKTGLQATVGSGGYLGRSAYVQYGAEWRVKGGYSDYRYDSSTGTTRTLSLRGSYQGERLAAGVKLSVTPRNDAYANRAFGVDAGWTFILDDADEPTGLSELELGGWWTQTRHSQIVPKTLAVNRERDVVINQHDLGLSAALTGWDFTLAIDAFRSLYDQDFGALPTAAIRLPRLGETASLVNSFPERGGGVNLEYMGWEHVTPYVTISTTKYKIQPQPATTTTGAGVALKRGAFGLDLGLERTHQAGAKDTRYFTFGGSFRF
jgi:hypothetical protein